MAPAAGSPPAAASPSAAAPSGSTIIQASRITPAFSILSGVLHLIAAEGHVLEVGRVRIQAAQGGLGHALEGDEDLAAVPPLVAERQRPERLPLSSLRYTELRSLYSYT